MDEESSSSSPCSSNHEATPITLDSTRASINNDQVPFRSCTPQTYEHNKRCLQQQLKFFFMSPLDKWRLKGRWPLKLMFQLLKILFVTIQLISFGTNMSDYLLQQDTMNNAFREILLENWDPQREIVSYPPSIGPYAVFTKEKFYSSLNYAIRRYSNFSKESVGLFGYSTEEDDQLSTISITRVSYYDIDINPSRLVFNISDQVERRTIQITDLYPPGDKRWLTKFDIVNLFALHNFTVKFESLVELSISLPLR